MPLRMESFAIAMNPDYQPFSSYGSWDAVGNVDGGEMAQLQLDVSDELASFFVRGSEGDERVDDASDASSVASNDDAPILETFPSSKEFPSFEDLRGSILSFARLAPAQVGDNSRCATKVDSLPTKWLRDMFPSIQGSVKYSGFLYCRCNHALNCDWKVHYKLQQNGTWIVSGTSVWTHNHQLEMLSTNLPAASGLVHLKSVQQLSVEHRSQIIAFLESGLTVKVTRFKFRAKFPGFELRARCCKSVKYAYLKDKYGADRHQMSLFLQQLQKDCDSQAGGVFTIAYAENMEIAELYYQMPLLRKVGEYFGKFSVIDMSHNMSMYERHMATFNVISSNP